MYEGKLNCLLNPTLFWSKCLKTRLMEMGRVGKMTCLLHKKVKQCKFLVKTFTPWRARDETTKGWERIHFDSILNTTVKKSCKMCLSNHDRYICLQYARKNFQVIYLKRSLCVRACNVRDKLNGVYSLLTNVWNANKSQLCNNEFRKLIISLECNVKGTLIVKSLHSTKKPI